jgi:hypothetical protein
MEGKISRRVHPDLGSKKLKFVQKCFPPLPISPPNFMVVEQVKLFRWVKFFPVSPSLPFPPILYPLLEQSVRIPIPVPCTA